MDQVSATAANHGSAQISAAATRAPLTFIRPQASKPVFYSAAMTGGAPKIFFESEDRPVPIFDMRPIASVLSIDHEGFELLQHETGVDDLYDDEAIKGAYAQEVEALINRRFGASKVYIFDVTRRSDAGAGARNPDGSRGPAGRLHVDYTAKSGPQRVRDILGDEEAERLATNGARLLQVNIWRPINGPVKRSPLALADASTVSAGDLVATDQIFPDRVGEIYSIAYSPRQRWYYAPEMARDEVLLIKGWDSLEDGRARFTPHGAFNLPDTPADAPARESIEVRTLVVIN